MAAYEASCDAHELHMYRPFQNVAQALTNTIRTKLRRTAEESTIKYWNDRGKYVLLSAASRKPDLIPIHELETFPTWMIALLIFEFKRHSTKGPGTGLTGYTTSSNDSRMTPTDEQSSSAMSTSSTSHTSHNSRASTRSNKSQSTPKKPTRAGTAKSTPTAPRARTIPDIPTTDAISSGRRRSARLSKSQTQSGSAAKSLMLPPSPSTTRMLRSTRSSVESAAPTESGNDESASVPPPSPTSSATSQKRKYTGSDTGSVAKRARQSHNGKITSDQLQLATYALECLDASTRHYTTGVFIDNFKVSLWYYDRACIIRTKNFDLKEEPLILALILFAISECGRLKTAGFDPYLRPDPTLAPPTNDRPLSAVVGSRMVFPDGPRPDAQFQIKSILYQYRGLIGRGTMVYAVTRIYDGGRKERNQALKMGWPVAIRPKEASIIEDLRKAIPAWKDHLPELYFTKTMTAKELNLPRVGLLAGLSCKDGLGLEDRDLHILAMKKYQKLWEVNSIEEFKDVFVDCVECE
jgi:hypothetical protein